MTRRHRGRRGRRYPLVTAAPAVLVVLVTLYVLGRLGCDVPRVAIPELSEPGGPSAELNPPEPGPLSAPPESMAEGNYRVQRVVDGDTLLLTSGARVRLIGVNAPESVKPDHAVEPFGPEAGQFAKDFVARAGGEVRLVFDKERVDQYGRFLAYVWVGDRMLNEELLRAGLARVERQYRYSPSIKTQFLRAESEARAARRGVWSED